MKPPAKHQLTFAGRQTAFKHELGALYVAYLLLAANEPWCLAMLTRRLFPQKT